MGFASGRGSSLLRELRNAIPKQLWSRVYAGMYNGALVVPLSASMPDSIASSPVLEELGDRMRGLVDESSVLIELRASVTPPESGLPARVPKAVKIPV